MHTSRERTADAVEAGRTGTVTGLDSSYQVSPDACSAVSRWVEMHSGTRADAETVRAALDATVLQLCAEARGADAMRVERLVIALHECWPMLPAVHDAVPHVRRLELLDRLVSACIATFYDVAPADSR